LVVGALMLAAVAAIPASAADPAPTADAACPALLQHTFNRLQTNWR
jgi:hypothetical protein